MAETRFVAAAPTGFIHDTPSGRKIKQVLWGDFVSVTGASANGWSPVSSRGSVGFMRDSDLGPDRLLEIVFVDVGQGDGALVVTPDDQHLLIDAGEADNMFRFLRWRYGRFEQPRTFDAAVISHPDEDHYGGFDPLFSHVNVNFGAVFHNGLVERVGADSLGARAGKFLTDIVLTQAQLRTIVGNPALRGGKHYPKLLHELLGAGRAGDVRGVSAADGHLPGFAPAETASGLAIQVLGPVHDTSAGAPRLPWFGDAGLTKNGHSVVLRLTYGDISVLLGGDLNVPAEHHLLRHYTGHAMPPSETTRSAVIEGARRIFRCDVAKACHHGSADFTDVFLQSVDPLVTVISSGDNEPHSHPRADALGAVGRWGRGNRPLVFSTELARSAPEVMKHPVKFRADLAAAQVELAAAAPGGPAETKALARLDKLNAQIDRSVAVYGSINLRSDGKRIVMAQKVEAPNRVTGQWDAYLLEPDAAGVLRYVSQH